MKHFKTLCTLTAVLFFSLAICVAAEKEAKPSKADDGSQLVVEVNGNKLTRAQLVKNIDEKLAPVLSQIPPDRLETLKAQLEQKMTEEFIQRTVLTEAADKNKIKVSDQEVQDQLETIKKSLPEGVTLETALQSSGLTLEKMREDVAFGLRINKLIDSQVKMDANPTEEQIKAYYEENKKKFEVPETVQARHILIKSKEGEDETAKKEKRAKIDDLRKKLLAGEDFAKLAQENSDCPSKAKGGDLGSFSRGRMVKAFEDAAFGQKVNEIGPVVETRFGYHIIQVTDKKPAKSQSLDEARDKISKTLSQKNKNDAVKKYIDGLTAKAKIVYGKKQ